MIYVNWYHDLQVVWKYFYSKKSTGEHGTLYQLRNLVNRSNVVVDPVKAFNACDDFLKLVVTCHILTASMEVLGMKSLGDTPSEVAMSNPQNVWMETKTHRKAVLQGVCDKIVDEFLVFQYNEAAVQSQDETDTTDEMHDANAKPTDLVKEYSKQVTSLGTFYLQYADAIQEGDGERVLRCWRYLLLIFKSSGRKNYSIEALRMLNQYYHESTPRQSAQLIWAVSSMCMACVDGMCRVICTSNT